jgi:hypothetical protein
MTCPGPNCGRDVAYSVVTEKNFLGIYLPNGFITIPRHKTPKGEQCEVGLKHLTKHPNGDPR